MKLALIAVAATLMTSGAAFAQQAAPSGQVGQAAQAYVDAAFGQIDANKDGSISKEEFKSFTLSRLAQQQAAFQGAFAKADANKDGKLSKEEAAAVNPQFASNFPKLDGNADGFVTIDEIRAAARRAAGQPASK